MEIQNFEESLLKMSKPEVKELRHQEMLANAISDSKSKTVFSFWWIIIPIYLSVMFIMKSCYMPNSSMISGIHEFAEKEYFLYLMFFLITPFLFIILNLNSIRKIYYLSGSSGAINFLRLVRINILIIILSIVILIIYLI